MRQGGEREGLGLGSRILCGGALSPRPVRGAAAGVEHRVVGQFTAAPPVPRRRSRAWNSGAESARTVRNSATRRARSSGVSGPKRCVVEASEEISVRELDRPLHWAKGWLE